MLKVKIFFGQTRTGNLEGMEKEINSWLKEEGLVDIVSMSQAASSVDIYHTTSVCILYKEKQN